MTHTCVDEIDKYHAMSMCCRTTTTEELIFDKEKYTGREVISKFIPKINYTGTAKYYEPAFAPYIDYREDEINVVLKNGELESGILDSNSFGQGSSGGIPHIAYIEKGAPVAINMLFNLQQVVDNYSTLYKGISFGFAYLSKSAREKINLETQKIMSASLDIAKQLEDGKLIAPIGMTLDEYYEELQMAALEHGDEFLKPVMEELDIIEDDLYRFIASGSKGKKSNMMYIYTAIGSIGIKGRRIKQNINDRTSINFQRFSTDPMARGYNPSNFMLGIPALVYPFAAQEARYELIEVALSTAKAGTMNRDGTKNLESIVVSNLRSSKKEDRLVQLLYGETGIDPRKVEKVLFPTIKISTAEFNKYKTPLKSVDKIFQNKIVDKSLVTEFGQLSIDRELFRKIFLKMEANSRGSFVLQDSLRMPVNIARIINNVMYLDGAKIEKTKDKLDPLKAINLVKEYCDSIGYVYMNYIQRKAKAPIPIHIENAVILLKILIRSYLCTSELIKNNINNILLELILERITHKISCSFIQYGTSVGVIAAQSISEPMTQYLLDAKHRTGLQKKGINVIDRFDEILRNKPTKDMISPTMILIPVDAYINDKFKVQEIANHIEMLTTERFITSTKIFLEQYGKPEYPPLVDESKMINKFRAMTLGDNVPKDLINWCIRYTFSKQELILKSMKMNIIHLKLQERYPNLYIVYTPQSDKELIMRIYMRNIMFKKSTDINLSNIVSISDMISKTVIRGVDGIKNTAVIQISHSFIKEDGSIDHNKDNFYGIETDGTNLSKILENKYLNSHQCSSSSIHEIEKMYGIEAARNKTVDELMKILDGKSNYEHASIYADEMTYNGRMTSIQRSGLGKREVDNVMLRATFGSPIQVITNAAINSQTDHLYGMSAPLVMGTVPKYGTTFNDVCICAEEVARLNKTVDNLIDEL